MGLFSLVDNEIGSLPRCIDSEGLCLFQVEWTKGPYVNFRGFLITSLLFLQGMMLIDVGRAAADPVSEWQDLYDGGASLSDGGTAALTDTAGNLIVAGESRDGVGGADMLIRKLHRVTGDTLWTKRIAADDGNDMQIGGMVWDSFGNVLVGGTRLGCFG